MPRWPYEAEIGPGVLVSIVLSDGLILTGLIRGEREARHHDSDTTLDFDPEFLLVELTADFAIGSTTVYRIGTFVAVNAREVLTIGRP